MKNHRESHQAYAEFHGLLRQFAQLVGATRTVDKTLIKELLDRADGMTAFLQENDLAPIVDSKDIKRWADGLDDYNKLASAHGITRTIGPLAGSVYERVLVDSGTIEDGDTSAYQQTDQEGATINCEFWGEGLPYANVSFEREYGAIYWGLTEEVSAPCWIAADKKISDTLVGVEVRRHLTLPDDGSYILKARSYGLSAPVMFGPCFGSAPNIWTIDEYLQIIPPFPPNFPWPWYIYPARANYGTFRFAFRSTDWECGPAAVNGVEREIALRGPGQVEILETTTYRLQKAQDLPCAYVEFQGVYAPLEWELYRLRRVVAQPKPFRERRW
jgi:hypothetical protein